MKIRDLKYFLAYVPALAAFLGLTWGGWWTFSTVAVAFFLTPALELFLKGNTINHLEEEEESRLNNKLFDFLLFLNLPVLYALLVYYFFLLQTGTHSTLEHWGMAMSLGIILGTVGINVAHEIGHRENALSQFTARALLLPSFYMHFNIEHNLGHHKHVATERDPSSARKGESLYAFWVRSVYGVYTGAWTIESKILKAAGESFWSIKNRMIWFQLSQLSYLAVLFYIGSWRLVGFGLAVGIIGFLLLETVNYIEHYGLRRNKLASGRYEPVSIRHSWNSNHEVGRILLYELTRHADHHYKASRKYQILRHRDESPQLPTGYPGSMLMSLIPPIWHSVMKPRLEAYYHKAD